MSNVQLNLFVLMNFSKTLHNVCVRVCACAFHNYNLSLQDGDTLLYKKLWNNKQMCDRLNSKCLELYCPAEYTHGSVHSYCKIQRECYVHQCQNKLEI
jgi:hypothetical protein